MQDETRSCVVHRVAVSCGSASGALRARNNLPNRLRACEYVVC